AGLGGGVIDLAVLAGLAVDRTDVDDPPVTASRHPVPHRLGHVEHAAEVDVDHLAPLAAIHPLHRRIAGDARIVDEDVDGPELALHLAHALDARVEVGYVPLEALDPGALGELARPFLIAGIIGRDLHAHVAQRHADCFADAARTARHDRHSSHQNPPPAFGSGA